MNNIFYPKQLYKNRIIANDNQCFFAMPFSEQYINVYDTIELYLEKEGFNCIRVDNNLEGSVPIINLILQGIATSQYVIVDISETNANVFYELGITHTVKEGENVFVIKEKEANTPFDIQHLQYIKYDKNNLKHLAEELLKRLKANQYKNLLKKILSEKQIVKFLDSDEIVDYYTKIFAKEYILTYTGLLEATLDIYKSEKEIIESIWEYDKILRNELKKGHPEMYISVLFKFFSEILMYSCQINEITKYINDFLNFTEYSNLDGEALLPYQTNLAIKFAENSKLSEITIKWVIEYFQRSKSTKVDLNRYKLEAFLLKTTQEKVDEFIINALLSENNYIREHMADIVGEKKIYAAEDNLITQLKRESNIYTVSSIIEALGKIKSTKSLDSIHEYLRGNSEKLIGNKNFFVLKHIRNALLKIAPQEYLKDFDNKYLNILITNNAI